MEPLPEITKKMLIPSKMTLKETKEKKTNQVMRFPTKSAGTALAQEEGFSSLKLWRR